MNNSRSVYFKLIVSVLFGLAGFAVNFLDVRLFQDSELVVSLLPGLFFPLLIALAWGWKYGLLSALAGGCQTMWWLWSTDGFGVLYAVPVFTLWVVWHGWWADRREKDRAWYKSSFLVEIPFRILAAIGFYTIFTWLVSLNPPPWDPAVVWDHVPASWVTTVVIKHLATAYLFLLVAYIVLSLGPVRKFFGLRRRTGQRDTNLIIAGGVLLAVAFWVFGGLVDYLHLNPENYSLLDTVLLKVDDHAVIMRGTLILAALVGTVILARFTGKRAVMRRRLLHLNRVLAAVRNVNQLITREKNRNVLLEETCRLLTENRGYQMAWVVLTEDGKPVDWFHHCETGTDFREMDRMLESGELPDCIREPMKSGEVEIIEDPPEQCGDCPLSDTYGGNAAMITGLESEGTTLGFLGVSIPEYMTRVRDELDLLEEVAGDISFALRALQREKELGRTESILQATFQSSGEAVLVVSSHRRVIAHNERFVSMWGVPEEVMENGEYPEVLDRAKQLAADPDFLNSKARELFGTRDEDYFTVDMKDGRKIEIHDYPLLQDDRLQGRVWSFRDVTERFRLETQLQQSQRMESIGRLAGGLAHDFNNFLTAILGYVELSREQLDEGHAVQANLKEIEDAAGKSARLIKQLMAFARRQTAEPVVLDMNRTIGGMITMLRQLIGEDIKLSWTPAEVWPVRMDPSQVDQILANLAVNARDAIDGVGSLSLTTGNVNIGEDYCLLHPDSFPGEYVLLSVADTGCGMDRETLEHIFEPFYTTKPMDKGTGLGLSMVHGVVKQNGGFINAYSEPGEGTVFRIYLPRCETEPETPEEEAGAGGVPRGSETVLLVEDEESIRKTVASFLKKLGYSVVAAGSPEEALEKGRAMCDSVDLMLTDVVMPGMNGVDLAEELEKACPELKSIFMSGYTADSIIDKGILKENGNFLPKPFTREELARKVRSVLDG